ncbi:cytochrome P450 family protein [Actinacidiphila sp. bgisy167]|uniref:cytochrome P450 family protein n=1 Tax=Actinacidiphila sp. bgisy167 TaxID=3413797 RepID=UPI003D7147B6
MTAASNETDFPLDRAVQDAQRVMAQRRSGCPVGHVHAGSAHGDGWLVTRYDEVMSLLTDPRVKRDQRNVPELDTRDGHDSLLYLDPPDHTRIRRLVNKTFTPRSVEPLRPKIEQLADELLDSMAAQGEVDLVSAFALPIPLLVISELLGVPEEDREAFATFADAFNGTQHDPEVAREAHAYLEKLVAGKRAEPADDLLSALALAAAEDGGTLSETELLHNATLLLVAGYDTTVYLIANTVLALLQAPQQLAQVRANPALLPAAIEEVLRYDSPVNISSPRWAAEPITLSGVTVPAGEPLLISIMSANRDADHFDDPDRFDIHRDHSVRHLGFGHGIHYCPGAPLARMETLVAVGKLIERFPELRLAVSPDTLTMRDSLLMHGPASLPVRLS